MPQSEEQKIRSRLRSYERKLQQEKEKYGYYHDGAGKRYLIGPHYLLLGDNDGALAAFKWFEKEFPDDIGEPIAAGPGASRHHPRGIAWPVSFRMSATSRSAADFP